MTGVDVLQKINVRFFIKSFAYNNTQLARLPDFKEEGKFRYGADNRRVANAVFYAFKLNPFRNTYFIKNFFTFIVQTFIMKRLSIVLMAGIFFAACSKKSTPAGTSTTSVAAAPVVSEVPKPSREAAAGMETYNTKCGNCHALKKVDNWTASEWVPILDDMASKANLDAKEKANVLTYVQFYAKAGK